MRMPSPVVAYSAHDHVAGLLAAERVAADPHRLEHVAVADLGLPDAEPGRLHRLDEAEVAHHRGHDGVVDEPAGLGHPERQDREELVAVDVVALVVDGQAAVGVAVEGDAGVGAVLDDGRLQRAEVGGAAAVVDVEAVGLGADHDDLGAGRPQRHAARPRCAAPLAQSTTTLSPVSGRSSVASRWSTYSSTGRS